jgi:hypothetical protein
MVDIRRNEAEQNVQWRSCLIIARKGVPLLFRDTFLRFGCSAESKLKTSGKVHFFPDEESAGFERDVPY